jgi:glycosyltransferase involved in cell wall biosynthesis
MRITFVNTYDNRGGAARAAFRLFRGVYDLPGVEAVFVTKENATGHPGVLEDHTRLTSLFGDKASVFDQKGLKKSHPDRILTPFSVNRIADTVHETILKTEPDIVHLHWPHAGFLRIESLAKLEVPIVWTLHDMWAFTGVCHYSNGCRRFMNSCGSCPLLRSENPTDISAKTFLRKQKVYTRLDLTITTPSYWLASLARRSSLLAGKSVITIPNCIDTELFKPKEQSAARKALGLPPSFEIALSKGRPLVLVGASHALQDDRKGCTDLLDSVVKFDNPPCYIVFGAPEKGFLANDVFSVGNVKTDLELVNVYSACDFYAFPSRQDNLPNTVMEALACGLPVVAFDVGGVPEMVHHAENGYLVPAKSLNMNLFIQSLEQALKSISRDTDKSLSRNARATALQKYSTSTIANRFFQFYEKVSH